MREATKLTVRVDKRATVTVKGRDAWALQNLIAVGAQGLAPIERPAPRWSSYVHRLRKRGIHIETIREPHQGAFAGSHGRYVLRSPVDVLEVQYAGAERAGLQELRRH